MAVSTTTTSEVKQPFGYEQLFSAGANEDPSLDELIGVLDGIDDPFVQMVFILNILMPAMVKVKEDNLDELATSLEAVASYTSQMTAIQEAFNELEDPESDFAGLATQILEGIGALRAEIEAGSVLDESLTSQILSSLNGMEELVLAGGSTAKEQGAAINRLWNPEEHYDTGVEVTEPNAYNPNKSYWEEHVKLFTPEIVDESINPYYADTQESPDGKPAAQYFCYVPDHVWDWYVMTYRAEEGTTSGFNFSAIMEDDQTLKGYLDDFNVLGTSMKSQSALTQALVEHDSSEYNAFIALNKDMFKEFHNQIRAHEKALQKL